MLISVQCNAAAPKKIVLPPSRAEQRLLPEPFLEFFCTGAAPSRAHARASCAVAWPLMTREDLAAFMIDALTDDTWLRRSPLIGY